MLTSIKKILAKKKYSAIPLVLTGTNHFEIKAEINGVSGRFILDTGASNTCVGMDKAEHFKLISETSDVKAAGAGAKDMETMISERNTIEIGEWNYNKQKIVLFDLNHVNEALIDHEAEAVDGIIGSDILKKSKAIIDYSKRRVYLKKR